MKNLIIIDHPLVKINLTILRDQKTPFNKFRDVLNQTSTLMAYEVTKDIKIKAVKVKTPLMKTDGAVMEQTPTLVPILRAGLGMMEGFLQVLPEAKIGHVGLYRDEATLEAICYFSKIPHNIDKSLVIILDPMLATGGSAISAVDFLKKNGAKKIKFASIISAPEGVNALQTSHSDIQIFTCSLDKKLNQNGYILPGLGDAGDRIFGTE